MWRSICRAVDHQRPELDSVETVSDRVLEGSQRQWGNWRTRVVRLGRTASSQCLEICECVSGHYFERLAERIRPGKNGHE